MQKEKRQSKIINFLGVIVGIVFLLIAISTSFTNDTSSALILGALGLVFIFLSLTPLGETDIQNPYVRVLLFPFIPILSTFPKKISWLFILGILALSVLAVLAFVPDLVPSWLQSK